MQRLRKLREDKGMTQEELSERIHVSQQRISAYENERATPPIDVLLRYAEFFSISTDYLLSCDRKLKTLKVQVEYMLNEEEMDIIDAYRLMSESNKKIVRTLTSVCYEIEHKEKER